MPIHPAIASNFRLLEGIDSFEAGLADPVVPPPTAALAALMRQVPRLLRFLPEDRRRITTNYVGGPESRADGLAPARTLAGASA